LRNTQPRSRGAFLCTLQTGLASGDGGRGLPDGAEPLCLFLVTSASWHLWGVKRPPKQSSNGGSHREPWPANAGALSLKKVTRRSRVSLARTRTDRAPLR